MSKGSEGIVLIGDFEDYGYGWERVDHDGDGYNWDLGTNLWWYEEPSYCHSGVQCIGSASSSSDNPNMTPDNWVYSPAFTVKNVALQNVTVSITRLTEGADENPDDNTLSRSFDIVTEDFNRRVLLEEFTTEQCSNCPRVAPFLHNILEDEYYRENVVAVCHHSAYYTDWLTIPSDNDLTWYFNDGGANYAPAMMLDRWTTDPNGTTPVFIPNSQNDLKAILDYGLRQPAFMSVNIQAKIDTDENIVNMLVQGSRSKENLTVNPARITVWLVEDKSRPTVRPVLMPGPISTPDAPSTRRGARSSTGRATSTPTSASSARIPTIK